MEKPLAAADAALFGPEAERVISELRKEGRLYPTKQGDALTAEKKDLPEAHHDHFIFFWTQFERRGLVVTPRHARQI